MEKFQQLLGSSLLITFITLLSYSTTSAQQHPCFNQFIYDYYNGLNCITLYDPVCGCNGVTYSGECGAGYQGYTSTPGICGCSIPTEINDNGGSNLHSRGINWRAYAGADYYEVAYRPINVNTWSTVLVPSSSTSSYMSTNLSNLELDKLYRYKIRSRCSASNGWTNYSSVRSFKTDKCEAPTNITFTQLNNNKIRLDWDDFNYHNKQQIFYRIAGSADAWTKALVGLEGRTWKILTELLPGTEYEFKMRSHCEIEYGSFSWPLEYFTTSISGNQMRLNQNTSLSLAQVSPNPATDNLQLDFTTNDDQAIQISIVDLMGKQVFYQEQTFEANNVQYDIDISQLNNGCYILLMNDGKNVVSEKFVKIGG